MTGTRARKEHMVSRTARLVSCALVCYLSSSLVPPVLGQTSETAELTIKIVGIESDEGRMNIAVFNSEESWMETRLYENALDIEERACSWTIEEVPYGEYGVAVYHDENGNGKHDKNFLGIPKEPYGFSNNARGKTGPPGWEKTRFSISDPTLEIEIEVK